MYYYYWCIIVGVVYFSVLGGSECFEEYFTSDVCSLFGHMTVTCHVLQQNIITSFLSFTRHFNNLPNGKLLIVINSY